MERERADSDKLVQVSWFDRLDNPDGQYVRLRGEYYLPRSYTIFSEHPAYPYNLSLIVQKVRGGGWECASVTYQRRPGGPPVTSEGVRKMPVGQLLEMGARQVVSRRIADDAGHVEYVVDPTFLRADSDALKAARRGPPDPRDLRLVATIYREAFEMGLPPVKAVAERLNMSLSTAGKRVMAARETGWLGPAIRKGQAGEQPKGRAKRGKKP